MTERRSISHYDLLQKVGQGGMGAVYKAQDRKLDRIVALKFLHTDGLESETGKSRFLQEARAISRLSHRHIAVIHAIEECDQEIFLVFEYLSGGSLRTLLAARRAQGSRLRPEQVATYGLQMAEALAHAHARGIIHRDVKPANVMFGSDGDLKLVDFGLSKLRGAESLTESGYRIGTPLYMSPEQARGKEMDERSDIFSLGVVLYEMAAGQPPFIGGQPEAIVHRIIHESPPPIGDANPDCPPKLQAIVARALEKSPSARYQHMVEVSADLRSFLEETGYAAQQADATQTLTGRTSTGRARRWLWPLAAVPAVGILAVLMLPSLRDRLWNALPADKRIAVLPFENCAGKATSQAFCDGLLQSATTLLTQAERPETRVAITPASEIRRQQITNAATARKFAGANLAVAGKFQRSGNSVNIALTLIDTATQRVLGSATVPYDASHAAAIQEQLAAGMMVLLHSAKRAAASTFHRASPMAAANESYLRGAGYLERFDLPGNIENAIRSLEDAVHLDPKFADAHVALSGAYRRKYLISKDRAFIDSARTEATTALALDGSNAAAHVAAGVVMSLAGDREGAVSELQRALTIDPLDVQALRELAAVYNSAGRTSDAEGIYRKAIQLQPSEWVTYADLGVFHNTHQKYAEAEHDFRMQESLTPDSPLVHRNLGGVYIALGRFADAEREFVRSIQLAPTVTVYTNLGALYIFQGRYRDAIGAMEKATQLAPPAYRYAHVMWANLADAYRYTPDEAVKAPGAYHKAIEAAEQQLAFEPDNAELLSNVAVYWAKLGDRDKALDEIARAMRFAQGNRNISFHACIVYELAGARERALAALGDAIRGGYSRDEIEKDPELSKLRQDSRYQRLFPSAAEQDKVK